VSQRCSAKSLPQTTQLLTSAINFAAVGIVIGRNRVGVAASLQSLKCCIGLICGRLMIYSLFHGTLTSNATNYRAPYPFTGGTPRTQRRTEFGTNFTTTERSTQSPPSFAAVIPCNDRCVPRLRSGLRRVDAPPNYNHRCCR
jgi:hypothetical protein